MEKLSLECLRERANDKVFTKFRKELIVSLKHTPQFKKKSAVHALVPTNNHTEIKLDRKPAHREKFNEYFYFSDSLTLKSNQGHQSW